VVLNVAQLEADLLEIFTGNPDWTETLEEAATEWATAIDSFVSQATSSSSTIVTPGAGALQSGIEAAMALPGLPATFGDKLAAAMETPYLLLCTFVPESGICINLDDVGGGGFSGCIKGAVAIPVDDASVPASVIASCIETFVKAHRGQFPPPPDPNNKPIL
jgi:hypothetical protein